MQVKITHSEINKKIEYFLASPQNYILRLMVLQSGTSTGLLERPTLAHEASAHTRSDGNLTNVRQPHRRAQVLDGVI
jgi:hypothetical protein